MTSAIVGTLVIVGAVVFMVGLMYLCLKYPDLLNLFLVIAALLIIRKYVIEPYTIPTGSMEPTIQVGDYIYAEKVSLHFSNPNRGDIVIFHPPPEPEKRYVKRIIGLPGETIIMRGDSVLIANSMCADTLRFHVPSGSYIFWRSKVVILEKDEYFMVGDNHKNSSDSREWGPTKRGEIFGRPFFRYWPTSRIGARWEKFYHTDATGTPARC